MKWLLLIVAISGVVHADGFPTPRGPCDDVDACEQACKKNQTASCVWGGVLAVQNAVDGQMIRRALALFDKACMKGDTESCWNAARNSDDDTKTRKYYERACNKRHARSCFELVKLMDGAGDDKSKKTVVMIYKQLIGILEPRCDAKEVFACNKLGEVYEQMATESHERACQSEAGHPCH